MLNMKKENIFETEHGLIIIDLKKKMDEIRLSRYMLSKLSHTKYDTVDKYYHGTCYRMDLDILARFCHFLNCEPKDILKYIPEGQVNDKKIKTR